MDMTITPEGGYVESLEVEASTSTSIQVQWEIDDAILAFIEYFQVHYQKVASTYVQYGPKLPSTANLFEIKNLVADTYYKVCLVTKRNDTGPLRQCVDASTTNWQLPVSIGSSIGAILALSIIVLIVLLSRCQMPYKLRKKIKSDSDKYDAMSSNFHDERYFDFSETVTHGNDEDFTSDIEQGESDYCDSYKQKCPRKSGDKSNCINGNLRTPVTAQAHLLNQKRHSFGRICINAHGTHRSRPMPIRAYSMQTDQHPCSPLAKDPERRHSTDDEWCCSETGTSYSSFNKSHDILASRDKSYDTPESNRQLSGNQERIKLTPTRLERVLQKQKSISEQDDSTFCSQPTQDFLYIDEVPESNKMLSMEIDSTGISGISDKSKTTKTGQQTSSTPLANFHDFSSNSFQKCKLTGKRPQRVEVTQNSRMKLLHDYSSMEEHTV